MAYETELAGLMQDSMSPFTAAGVDPDQARLNPKAAIASLFPNVAEPTSWVDQAKAAGAVQPPAPGGDATGSSPSPRSTGGGFSVANAPSRFTPAVPTTSATIDGGTSSLADRNAEAIRLMGQNFGKASGDVDKLAAQPSLDSVLAPGQAKLTADSARANASPYNPGTTQVQAQYKPTFGQRLVRGVEGFVRGGVFGVIDPTIGGGTAYGSPNKLFTTQQQAAQNAVAGDKQSLEEAKANWAATGAAQNAVAKARTALGPMGKDATGASVEQQRVPFEQEQADTGQQNAATARLEAQYKSPEAKQEANEAEYQANLTRGQARGLKGRDLATYALTGNVPPAQQTPESAIAYAQAQAVFQKEHGRPPQTLEEETAVRQAAQGTKEPGTLMMVPDGAGGMKSTFVRPGDSVPAGATTVAGMGAASKVSDKEAKAYQQIVDDAGTAHELARAAESGNAPADVDLALSFFKMMKGSVSGIRFTQAEQNLIMGARSSAGDLQGVAQKVIGSGQKFTPDQRNKILQVIDLHAEQARKHLQPAASQGNGSAAGEPPPGAVTRDYMSLQEGGR